MQLFNTVTLHTDLIITERDAIASLTLIQKNKEIIFVTPFLVTHWFARRL